MRLSRDSDLSRHHNGLQEERFDMRFVAKQRAKSERRARERGNNVAERDQLPRHSCPSPKAAWKPRIAPRRSPRASNDPEEGKGGGLNFKNLERHNEMLRNRKRNQPNAIAKVEKFIRGNFVKAVRKVKGRGNAVRNFGKARRKRPRQSQRDDGSSAEEGSSRLLVGCIIFGCLGLLAVAGVFIHSCWPSVKLRLTSWKKLRTQWTDVDQRIRTFTDNITFSDTQRKTADIPEELKKLIDEERSVLLKITQKCEFGLFPAEWDEVAADVLADFFRIFLGRMHQNLSSAEKKGPLICATFFWSMRVMLSKLVGMTTDEEVACFGPFDDKSVDMVMVKRLKLICAVSAKSMKGMNISLLEVIVNHLRDLMEGIMAITPEIVRIIEEGQKNVGLIVLKVIFGGGGIAKTGVKTLVIGTKLNATNLRLENLLSVVPNWVLQIGYGALEILMSLKGVNDKWRLAADGVLEKGDNSTWNYSLILLENKYIFPIVFERLFLSFQDWIEIRSGDLSMPQFLHTPSFDSTFLHGSWGPGGIGGNGQKSNITRSDRETMHQKNKTELPKKDRFALEMDPDEWGDNFLAELGWAIRFIRGGDGGTDVWGSYLKQIFKWVDEEDNPTDTTLGWNTTSGNGWAWDEQDWETF